MTDDYVWDRFEVYPGPRESYRRHSLLLCEQRYRWMFGAYDIGGKYVLPNSPFGSREIPYFAAWALGLKRSGYATSPVYAQTLAFIIETYQLWKIDYEMIMA
jgi:flagellum-specific peptidoglycan hydrolase FlgJ